LILVCQVLIIFRFMQCKYDNKDNKEEYLVHKVYICSNLKYPFGLQYHDQIGGCTNTNNILQIFPSFSLKQQDQPEEGNHGWLWPCSIAVAHNSNIKANTFECHWSKSRMTCSQEGENDDDITCLDTTTLETLIQRSNHSLS
jgi:hypothetical protein